MFQEKIQKFLTQQRCVIVNRATFNNLTMRSCKVYSFAYFSKKYKVNTDFNKYVKYIRLSKQCDLTFFNFIK